MIKRIVCITGAISQPRFVKRINGLVEAGFDVIVVGYDRDLYNDNKLPKAVSFINKGTGRVISDTDELETLLRRIL